MLAATAVGVSHLVQSTRAGASFGMTLAFAIVLIVLLVIALLTPALTPVALAQPPSDCSNVGDPNGAPCPASSSTGDPILLSIGSSAVQAPSPTTHELSLLDLMLVTMPRLLFPFFGI